jgi:hypothetical protein
LFGGQLAQSNEIEREVNRVYEMPNSSADAKPFFDRNPMNLKLNSPEKAICVKISRIKREIHALLKKLFANRFQLESPTFWGAWQPDAADGSRVSGRAVNSRATRRLSSLQD